MDQKKQGQQSQGGNPKQRDSKDGQFDREPAEGSRDDMINQGNRDETNRGSRRDRQSDR